MSFINDIYKRTHISKIREFLLYGSDNEKYTKTNYKDRLELSYNNCLKIVEEYDETGENSKLMHIMNETLTEYQHIYMELGIQAGFMLANEMKEFD
jgi:hypothetical protein